jgi:hypothetical protein
MELIFMNTNVPTEADVFLKDEGDFTTVIFSEKALKLLDAQTSRELYNNCKLDIENSSVNNMKLWAKAKELTVAEG